MVIKSQQIHVTPPMPCSGTWTQICTHYRPQGQVKTNGHLHTPASLALWQHTKLLSRDKVDPVKNESLVL